MFYSTLFKSPTGGFSVNCNESGHLTTGPHRNCFLCSHITRLLLGDMLAALVVFTCFVHVCMQTFKMLDQQTIEIKTFWNLETF